jgi:signal peptidase I
VARGQRYHLVRNGFLPFLGAGLTVWWWRRRRPFGVSVEGASMLPTLAHGDFLVAVSMARPRRGSLVVVEHPERPGYEMV